MSRIQNFFGGRQSDVFSFDNWDPLTEFPFGENSSSALSNAFPMDRETSAIMNARIDEKETPEAHIFKVDMPGFKKEEIKVEVEEGRVLKISGKKKKGSEEKNENCHRVEISSSKFVRRFSLPVNARVGKMKSAMKNGVLTVTLPKR